MRIFSDHADRIQRVGVFGSRASGIARPESDIDLVVDGDVDPELEAHLIMLSEDCDLPVEVDLAAHALIRHENLRKHIDDNALPLFDSNDLRVARDRTRIRAEQS